MDTEQTIEIGNFHQYEMIQKTIADNIKDFLWKNVVLGITGKTEDGNTLDIHETITYIRDKQNEGKTVSSNISVETADNGLRFIIGLRVL